jgi:maleylacetoacetate isomerase
VKLYDYFRSSAAYRVRIALNLKGVVPDERTFVHLRMGSQRAQDYLALNPQGLVPALALDDGEVLTQSLAIIEYLDETRPEPPLLPVAPPARARVRGIALAIACEIHPLNNLRVLNYLREQLKQDDSGIGTWYRHWVTEGFRGLELQAREFSASGRYCFGDAVSLADVLLVPQMFNARRFKTDLAPFPTLVGISTHLEALPAFAAARPEVQPDAR